MVFHCAKRNTTAFFCFWGIFGGIFAREKNSFIINLLNDVLMKKISLLISLLVGVSLNLFAGGNNDELVVRLLDDPDLRMPLTENTVVKLQSVSVKIQNPDEAPEVRLLSKMRSIAFDGGVVSGIADVKTSASLPSFSVSGDVLSVMGVAAGSTVCVYGIDARLYATVNANESGIASVSLPSDVKVCVVKTLSGSFKLIRK